MDRDRGVSDQPVTRGAFRYQGRILIALTKERGRSSDNRTTALFPIVTSLTLVNVSSIRRRIEYSMVTAPLPFLRPRPQGTRGSLSADSLNQ